MPNMRHTNYLEENKGNKVPTEANSQNSCDIPTKEINQMGQKTEVIRWPLKDEIAWMEERLREQEDPECSRYVPRHVPKAEDIKVWLARKRDKKSWGAIAKEILGADENNLEAKLSLARRAYERVERYWTTPKSDDWKKKIPLELRHLAEPVGDNTAIQRSVFHSLH